MLANLANDHKFAKVSPANFSHSYIATQQRLVMNILLIQCVIEYTSVISVFNQSLIL